MTRGTARILSLGSLAALIFAPIAIARAMTAGNSDSLITIGIVFFVGILAGFRYRTGYRCTSCQSLAVSNHPGLSVFWTSIIPPKNCPNCDEPMPE